MKKPLATIFWFLVVVFVFIALQLTVPAVGDLFKGSKLFLLPMIVFFLLGAALTYLVIKEKTAGRSEKFLLLTGLSAVGLLAGVILHNFFYAMAELTKEITVLTYIFEGLHAFFFILALFICPVGFLIGVAGSIILFLKNKNVQSA